MTGMQRGRIIYNLALIGFMGVGKSTIGQIAAAQLDYEFIDTDACIETTVGMPISRIFSEYGEAHFRACESALVDELVQRRHVVLATGGGLAANPLHLNRLREHALVVCLWASPEAIWERVRHQSHRPLLQTADPMGRIRELLAEREPHYRQADILVHTEMRTAREVAHQVVSQYRAASAPAPA
jgi:shikimate kinase